MTIAYTPFMLLTYLDLQPALNIDLSDPNGEFSRSLLDFTLRYATRRT